MDAYNIVLLLTLIMFGISNSIFAATEIKRAKKTEVINFLISIQVIGNFIAACSMVILIYTLFGREGCSLEYYLTIKMLLFVVGLLFSFSVIILSWVVKYATTTNYIFISSCVAFAVLILSKMALDRS